MSSRGVGQGRHVALIVSPQGHVSGLVSLCGWCEGLDTKSGRRELWSSPWGGQSGRV